MQSEAEVMQRNPRKSKDCQQTTKSGRSVERSLLHGPQKKNQKANNNNNNYKKHTTIHNLTWDSLAL